MGKGSSPPERVILPLLLYQSKLLLPGGVLRVADTCSNVSLTDLLLRQHNASEVFVAAVPAIEEHASTNLLEDTTHPNLDAIHHIGVAARVVQLVRNPQTAGWEALLEGRHRISVGDVTSGPEGILLARVQQLDYHKKPSSTSNSSEQQELIRSVLKGTRRLLTLAQGPGASLEGTAQLIRLLQAQSPAILSDRIGSLVARTHKERLHLLSTVDVTQRLRLVSTMLNQLLAVARNNNRQGSTASKTSRKGNTIRSRTPGFTTSSFDPGQGPGSLDGDHDGGDDDVDGPQELAALMARLQAAGPPPEALRAAQREYRRLLKSNEQYPGYAAALAYLETLADLPWKRRTTPQGQQQQQQHSLAWVHHKLDDEHYGMEKVKTRIVQYVAVHRLKGWDTRAPILCFIGAPGVGKTSLARSVAHVLGRPFQRISLGGVRDEAEIRGHRRTYIGSMPGRVIQALKKAGVGDPVLLLDEVDKMGKDSRGDPASALLEVLDPEQNAAFVDTYLGLPVDLSSVIFVATANSAAEIPPALLDRMEVVHLAGYTAAEKIHIAERHLVPRALNDHGLTGQVIFPPTALSFIVEGYTREAGVRGLSQCLAAVCRHIAVIMVTQQDDGRQPPQLQNPSAVMDDAAAAVDDTAGHGDALVDPITPTQARIMGGRRSVVHHYAFQGVESGQGGWEQCSQGGMGPAHEGHAWWLSGLHPISGPGYYAVPDRGGAPSTEGLKLSLPSASTFRSRSRSRDRKWLAWLPWHNNNPHQRSNGASGELTSPSASADSNSMEHAQPHLMLGPGSMGLLSDSSHLSNGSPLESDPNGWTEGGPYKNSDENSPTVAYIPAIVVDPALIEEVLGPIKFLGHDMSQRVSSPGVAAGLVWTSHGGKVQYIESLCVGMSAPGTSGTLTLTGQVGDVLEESARIALSWVRYHAAALGIQPPGEESPAQRWNVHCHLPAGAVPKDGPSAGVTLAVALVSLFTGQPMRDDVAMTGELTLRGLVLPVGGLKEKLIAAHAAGMKKVVVPARNLPEVNAELPQEVRDVLEVVGAERLDQVLRVVFDPPLEVDAGQMGQPLARL